MMWAIFLQSLSPMKWMICQTHSVISCPQRPVMNQTMLLEIALKKSLKKVLMSSSKMTQIVYLMKMTQIVYLMKMTIYWLMLKTTLTLILKKYCSWKMNNKSTLMLLIWNMRRMSHYLHLMMKPSKILYLKIRTISMRNFYRTSIKKLFLKVKSWTPLQAF